jgi:hypothetical protein
VEGFTGERHAEESATLPIVERRFSDPHCTGRLSGASRGCAADRDNHLRFGSECVPPKLIIVILERYRHRVDNNLDQSHDFSF